MTTTEKFSKNPQDDRMGISFELPPIDPERLAVLRANRMHPIDFDKFEAWRRVNMPEQRTPQEEASLWNDRIEAERIAIRAWARDGLVHSPTEYVPDVAQGPLTEEEFLGLEAYAAHCLGQIALERSNLIVVRSDTL